MAEQWHFTPEAGSLQIGRSPDSDILLHDQTVSRRHAELYFFDNQWFLRDLDSNSGIRINGDLISEQALHLPVEVQIGLQKLLFRHEKPRVTSRSESDSLKTKSIFIRTRPQGTPLFRKSLSKPLILGRSADCDLSLPDSTLPHRFFLLHCEGDLCIIRDLSGEFRFESGQKRCQLFPGDFLSLPELQLEWDGTNVEIWQKASEAGMHIEGLQVQLGERTLLHPVNLDVQSGEFLGIIGLSGQGKSTLLKAMAREIPCTGSIQTNPGTRIGWLEQEAPLIPTETAGEILRDASRMRLPRDLNEEERQVRIDALVAEFRLEEQLETPAHQLSGGERKRCALICELLAQPDILLLDEATSGLDPRSDTEMMEALKTLSQQGQTIVATTHNYSNLNLFDRILIVHEGHCVFLGSPDDALAFFNARHPAQILEKATSIKGKEGATRFQRSAMAPTSGNRPLSQASAGVFRRKFASCSGIVSRRYFHQIIRDQARFISMVLQPVILGLLFLFLFGPQASRWTLAFGLALLNFWYSLSGSIREIVNEHDLLRKELRFGLSATACAWGKFWPIMLLSVAQTLLTWSIFCLVSGQSALLNPGTVAGVLTGAAAGTSLGLLISAISRTQAQAITLLPLLLMPQLMFAGAMVPIDEMSLPGRLISVLTPVRWIYDWLRQLYTSSESVPLDLLPALFFALVSFFFTIFFIRRKR